jgi:hypothetical protein
VLRLQDEIPPTLSDSDVKQMLAELQSVRSHEMEFIIGAHLHCNKLCK